MEETIKRLLEGNAVTDEEREELEICQENIINFTKLVFERLGEPYKKKIVNTKAMNELGLYCKYGRPKDCISYCASEDVYAMGKLLRDWQCCDCEKTNHKDCGIYAMLCAVDSEINEKEDGCPYKF